MKVKTKKLEGKKLSTENKEVKLRKERSQAKKKGVKPRRNRTVKQGEDSYEKNQGKEMRRD